MTYLLLAFARWRSRSIVHLMCDLFVVWYPQAGSTPSLQTGTHWSILCWRTENAKQSTSSTGVTGVVWTKMTITERCTFLSVLRRIVSGCSRCIMAVNPTIKVTFPVQKRGATLLSYWMFFITVSFLFHRHPQPSIKFGLSSWCQCITSRLHRKESLRSENQRKIRNGRQSTCWKESLEDSTAVSRKFQLIQLASLWDERSRPIQLFANYSCWSKSISCLANHCSS